MYIDLLTKIKNAQAVKKEFVKVPVSKNDERILEILAAKKFISGFEKKGRGVKKIFNIKLRYEDNGRGAIHGIKFISKPSRHLYIGYKDIKPIRSGYGTLIISTPKGIMSGEEAKKMKLGGEAFFEIW
jgi:small subunit ribosomal protein S8